MKRSRFTEEQIIGGPARAGGRDETAELCRKHGISEPTFHAWNWKFNGMSVPDARRLKQLEEGNARLKKLLVYFW